MESLRKSCFDTVRDALVRVKKGWAVVEAFRRGEIDDTRPDFTYAQFTEATPVRAAAPPVGSLSSKPTYHCVGAIISATLMTEQGSASAPADGSGRLTQLLTR
ncbi:hypothetical protein GCM10023346_38020 [Arthrobacter gyeryongensis]|uniref:Uncharacterized protein n=1 Tax=Arthrobacter gyeryongensis TaxID=1650592 RepID=A0ABP9SMF7_9MICC